MLLTSHPELLHPKVLNPLRAAQKNPKIQEKNTQKIHPKIREENPHTPKSSEGEEQPEPSAGAHHGASTAPGLKPGGDGRIFTPGPLISCCFGAE